MSSIYLATIPQANSSNNELEPNSSETIEEQALSPNREASQSIEPSFSKLYLYASSDGSSENGHLVKVVLK